jgi:hypothetical protein
MRSTSLAAGAAAVIAVAVAGAAPAIASAPPAQAPATPMCTTSQLTASLGGSDAAAGNLYTYLVLTNHGSTTCHLTGYPGVSLLDSAGRQIGEPADREPSRYAPVVLKPGASASDTIHTANHMGTCLPTSAKIRIYPPGNTASTVIAGKIANCHDTFTITPMAAGTQGSVPVGTPRPTQSTGAPSPSTGGQVSAVPSGAPDTGLAATGGSGNPDLTVGLAAGGAALVVGGLGLAAARRRGHGG